MSILVNKNTKIFIACPANFASGGPELLHQLAFSLLNDFKLETNIYYYEYDKEKFQTPVHPEYKTYNIPYVLEITKDNDVKENIFIVPEVLSGLKLLEKVKNIRKGVWFLSVDNYYFSKVTRKDFFVQRVINKLMKFIHKEPIFELTSNKHLEVLEKKYNYKKDYLLRLANFYMTNSYRGLNWYKNLKPMYYLSEYLNSDFLKIKTNLLEKQNIVAFNPKKGEQFTKKILENAKDINFVPIINMTRDEVIKTLQRAKVYIDFGNHPGKDRIPREAAVLGCCVITGRRGSAAFYEDVPIPDEYKFEDTKKNIPKIIEKIRDCLENYEERNKDFNHYREIIKNEPQKFIEDLKKIFLIK
jgi:hypothetical protein